LASSTSNSENSIFQRGELKDEHGAFKFKCAAFSHESGEFKFKLVEFKIEFGELKFKRAEFKFKSGEFKFEFAAFKFEFGLFNDEFGAFKLEFGLVERFKTRFGRVEVGPKAPIGRASKIAGPTLRSKQTSNAEAGYRVRTNVRQRVTK
jgi:hypothetical protein